MSLYVIDASVTIKWIFNEIQTEKANLLLTPDSDLLAPDFMLIECANAIHKKVKNKEITTVKGDDGLRLLLEFGELKYVPFYRFLKQAYQIAREINHTVYDCLYLAVAEKYNSKVITADAKFWKRTQDTLYSSFIHWVESPI